MSSTEIAQLANGDVPVTGSATLTLQDAMDVNGTLMINSGTLRAGSNTINVGGNWDRNGGTFTAQTSTVTFDGTNQRITSSEDFYNFSKVVSSADTMTFFSSGTLTIDGTMRMQGAAGQLLSLRSSESGSLWKIDPSGMRLNDYLDVQDSDNIDSTIINPSNSTDSDNNVNWFASETVSGTTNLGAGTVRLAYNDDLISQTGAIGGGTWTISNLSIESDKVITVFVDGASTSDETTAIVRYDGSGNITGMVLDQNVLSIGSTSDNVDITLGNLGQYDNDNDPDVMHTSNSSILLVDPNNSYTSDTLSIISTGTLTVAGTITVHDMDINGTLTSSTSNTWQVDGNWDATGGSFTLTDDILFSSTSDAVSITSNGGSFNDIYISDGLVAYWKFDTSYSDDCTTNSAYACDASGFAFHSELSGNPTRPTSVSGTINFRNSESIAFDGSGDYMKTESSAMFNTTNLTIAFWLYIPTGHGNANFDRIMELGGFAETGGIGVEMTGTTAIRAIRWSASSQIGNSYTFPEDQWFHVLITSQTDPSEVHRFYINGTQSGADNTGARVVSEESLTLAARNNSPSNNQSNVRFDDFRMYNRVLSSDEINQLANGNQPGTGAVTFTLQDTLDVNGTLFINSGTLDVGVNNSITVGGDWENNGGDFLAQSGLVTLDGTGTQTIAASETFYDFTKTVTTEGTIQFGQGSTTTIDGDLTLSGAAGELLGLASSSSGTPFILNTQNTETVSYVRVQDSQANENDIVATDSENNGGNDDGDSSPYWIFGSIEVRTWDGGGGGDTNWTTAANWSSDTVPGPLDTARFDNTSDNNVTIDTDVTVAWIDVNSGYDGTITQDTGNTVTVNGTFSVDSGTFTGGNSLIDVNGTFDVASGATFNMTTGTMQVAGNFTLQSGATFNEGGTLKFDANLTYVDATSPQQDIGNLVVDPTTTLGSDLTASSVTILVNDTLVTDGYEMFISGTIDINGTLDATSGTDGNTTIEVGGLWDSTNGMFMSTDSTVIFTGTSGTATFSITGTQSFDNVKFDDNGGGTTLGVRRNDDC